MAGDDDAQVAGSNPTYVCFAQPGCNYRCSRERKDKKMVCSARIQAYTDCGRTHGLQAPKQARHTKLIANTETNILEQHRTDTCVLKCTYLVKQVAQVPQAFLWQATPRKLHCRVAVKVLGQTCQGRRNLCNLISPSGDLLQILTQTGLVPFSNMQLIVHILQNKCNVNVGQPADKSMGWQLCYCGVTALSCMLKYRSHCLQRFLITDQRCAALQPRMHCLQARLSMYQTICMAAAPRQQC